MSVKYDFTRKVIAITGGASGIGLATAELLASSGALISVADVHAESLAAAASKIEQAGGTVLTRVVNVADSTQVNDWIAATVDKFGKLDGAVNLAGMMGKDMNVHKIEDLEDDDWTAVIGVNLTGVMHCNRAQIRNMNPKGSIVNTASVAGVMGLPMAAAYTASKHGVVGLSRCAAKETGDRGIRVNCLAPGLIDTPMSRKSSEVRGAKRDFSQSIKRFGQPEEVAELIVFLLSDASQYISGTVQLIDGGWMC
ncbi:hypothetical protein Z517_08179 [Fonsecaea pedrosoi CBS 271.37]|uniref:Uncharacterized protein n=1 Tax=Fonsecaea pedrosoi CBS 271.37 TaxID=1442368 RepID=A0A0D2H0X4_9EURO|nr:uncharacterized protein Z517_08179 [Fonsecaea pedrosoi CBS 271.37]KIW78344.1 hypothetical protein Z517_08179 [Fonsecaea pedrosoi CBS 271.37]